MIKRIKNIFIVTFKFRVYIPSMFESFSILLNHEITVKIISVNEKIIKILLESINNIKNEIIKLNIFRVKMKGQGLLETKTK